MPAATIPFFSAPPPGVTELRATILAGADSTAILRAARACRGQSYALRRHMADGRVRPEHLGTTEDRIVDLLLMERVLASLSGAVAAAEARDPPPAPFVSVGAAVSRVVAEMVP